MARGNNSFKVWLVAEHGYKHTKPLQVRTLRRDAERYARHLQTNHNIAAGNASQRGRWVEPLTYTATQIDLVTHDGCHHLNNILWSAVGRNNRKEDKEDG